VIHWIAECPDNQCVDGRLIIVRLDQTERNRWARLHRRLGHRVYTYRRTVPDPDTYPEEQ
jgi:hypothetical protein